MSETETGNTTGTDFQTIPAETKIRFGKNSYRTKNDTDVVALEPVASQLNRHHALVCLNAPCMDYQKRHNGGRLLKVRMSVKPSRKLWVPACGGCGQPMTWENATNVANHEAHNEAE